MNPKEKGELTEQIIICEFLKLRIPVSKPIGDNQPYDLIIDINSRLFKVQSRTSRLDTKNSDNMIFNCLSYRVNTKTIYTKDNRDKFDLFVVYYPINNKVYVIDSAQTKTDKCLLSFNEQSKLRLAKDYELPTWYSSLTVSGCVV